MTKIILGSILKMLLRDLRDKFFGNQIMNQMKIICIKTFIQNGKDKSIVLRSQRIVKDIF